MLIAIVVIIAILILRVITIKVERAADKKNNPEKYNAIAEVESRPRIKLTYASGHPALYKQVNVYVSLNKSCIEMYPLPPTFGYKEVPPVLASIPVAAIKHIMVKDETSTGYETTPNRFIRFGTLALALKKKIVNEAAVLIIKWNDNHIDYETIFKKKGIAAVTEMNNAKNTLLKWVEQQKG